MLAMTKDNDDAQREPDMPSDHKSAFDKPRIDQTHAWNDETIRLTPASRYKLRVDGGRDETFRVNFMGGLNAREMHALIESLLSTLDEQPEVGLIALTKVEFIEPDTLEYRFWSGKPEGARLDRMFEMWQRMSQIHPIYTIDGIRYPWLVSSDHAEG